VEESGHGVIWPAVPALSRKHWGKPQNPSARMPSVRAETWKPGPSRIRSSVALHFVGLRFSRRWLWRDIFWDIMPSSSPRVNRHFGGTCHLHRRINQARNQHETISKQVKVKVRSHVVTGGRSVSPSVLVSSPRPDFNYFVTAKGFST
jgi:hypothetical protein